MPRNKVRHTSKHNPPQPTCIVEEAGKPLFNSRCGEFVPLSNFSDKSLPGCKVCPTPGAPLRKRRK